jgi:hypothetical protein
MKTRYLAILSAFVLMVVVSISCLLISHERGPLKFEPDSLPASKINVAYETEIHILQNETPVGEFSISKGALPAGMELVRVAGKDTAKIKGIPEEAGVFTFTVSVWCYGTNVSGQGGAKEYSIVVEK